MRWPSLLLLTALILAVPGCRILGPFSPFRAVEQLLIYPQSVAPAFNQQGQSGGRRVCVETEDHQRLDARYFAHPSPQAVALYCHGNVGTVDKWAVLAGRLSQRHRLSILVFDYRGYGRSTGIANERGILHDAEAARNWLAKENGIRPCDVVLIGRSLGGAVAETRAWWCPTLRPRSPLLLLLLPSAPEGGGDGCSSTRGRSTR